MAQIHTYDGGVLTTVRRNATEVTQSADHGAVGTGTFVIEDDAGTIEIVGQKDYTWEEDDDYALPLIFDGYIANRTYGRRAGVPRGPNTEAARGISVAVVDINDRLNHKLIEAGGKRPAERVQDRLEWLLGSDYAPFADNGRVAYPDDDMDKADYKYQYAGDVLADCALASGSGWNYFLANYGDGVELVFRNDNVSTADSSDVRISNVLADIDSDIYTVGLTSTFEPTMDAILTRDPSNVHSKHALSFAKGTEVEERDATATAFNGERGGTSSNSNIKRAVTARRKARRELHTHSTEADLIEVTIQVPASAVNLVYQGFRLQAKFSHLATEGYGVFTWMRVLERMVKPITGQAAYELALKLAPQEAADEDEGGECPYDLTPSGTHYPVGGQLYPDGNIHAISDGVFFYLRPGIYYPVAPNPGYDMFWHFWRLGTGGAGTIDYAGDCVQNELRAVVVGDGTMTIQTEIYGGSPRAMAYSVVKQDGTPVGPSVSFTSGDEIEIVIDDTSGADCVRIIQIVDASWPVCGGAWGWSQGVWAAA